MGFHAFGDFEMTRKEFEQMQPHTRTEMALLIQERLRQTDDERNLRPDMARCAQQCHSYRIPEPAYDALEALAS
ncbi:hypothetical protein MRBLMR1_004854 [Neorhizobium sp. LMR1-1-1.1]